MRLVRLICYSHSVGSTSIDKATQIATAAQENNKAKHITGMLTCSKDYYLQALEGPRASVCELLAKICRDPRHHTLTLIAYHEISERAFAQWSMGFVGLSSLEGLVLRFSPTPHLDPENLDQRSALALLVELSKCHEARIKAA